jgi:hypothetical protein
VAEFGGRGGGGVAVTVTLADRVGVLCAARACTAGSGEALWTPLQQSRNAGSRARTPQPCSAPRPPPPPTPLPSPPPSTTATHLLVRELVGIAEPAVGHGQGQGGRQGGHRVPQGEVPCRHGLPRHPTRSRRSRRQRVAAGWQVVRVCRQRLCRRTRGRHRHSSAVQPGACNAQQRRRCSTPPRPLRGNAGRAWESRGRDVQRSQMRRYRRCSHLERHPRQRQQRQARSMRRKHVGCGEILHLINRSAGSRFGALHGQHAPFWLHTARQNAILSPRGRAALLERFRTRSRHGGGARRI